MYIISSVTLITKTKLRNFENTAFLHFLCSKISLNSRHFISPTIVIENDGTTLFFYSLLICRRVTRMSFRGRQHIEVFEGWILPGGIHPLHRKFYLAMCLFMLNATYLNRNGSIGTFRISFHLNGR